MTSVSRGISPPHRLLCLAAALALAAPLAAQPQGQWSDRFDTAGINGRVFALGTWNGQPVAGGYRKFITDGARLQHLARFDGNHWRDIGGGVSGEVRHVIEFNGDLIVGGAFNVAGVASSSPVNVNNVARWDGSQWHPMGAGLGNSGPFGDTVWALEVYNGELYAGGTFAASGSQPIQRLARWTGSQWAPVGSGVGPVWSDKVLCLTVHQNRLYAGGEFVTGAGGLTLNNVVVWDGSTLSPVGGGLPGNAISVFALESFQGRLYAVGNFSQIGGPAGRRIAQWDGQSWSPVGLGIPDWAISTTVYSLQEYGGSLYVGGNFIAVNAYTSSGAGIQSRAVARWDGSQWHGLGGIAGMDLATTAIAMTVWDGRLIVGGEFTIAGTTLLPGQAVASYDVASYDGASWGQVGHGLAAAATKLLPWRGGIVAVGGQNEAGSAFATEVAFFDGADWRFMADIRGGHVKDGVIWNGDLVIVGDFTSIDGVPINGGARFDGTTWHALGAFGGGECVEVYQGTLYKGSLGPPARWDGTTWTQINAQIFGQVYDLHAHTDGLLYVGGYLNVFGGGPSLHLLAWDGSNTIGVGADDTVHIMHTHDGDLYVGGPFTQVAGVPAQSVARFDGSSWSQVGPGAAGGLVTALGSFQGDLLVGGDFYTNANLPPASVARWTGSSWSFLGHGDANFYSFLGEESINRLWVSGGFTDIDGIPSFGVGRWEGTAPPTLAVTQPGGPGTGVFVDNGSLVPGHEYFNVFSFEPCTPGPGTGPYLGLCASNPALLIQQLLVPPQTPPFHLIATAPTAGSGPYLLPPLTADGVCIDVTGGLLNAKSEGLRFFVR